MPHPPAFNHPPAFHAPAHHDHPFVRPVIIEEHHRPFIEPVVLHEQPVVIPEPIVAAPVVVQPIVFPAIHAAELAGVLAKLPDEGYKVHPANATSGSLEHGNFFTHFSATYTLTDAGLEVATASHQDKLREDIQKALVFAKA